MKKSLWVSSLLLVLMLFSVKAGAFCHYNFNCPALTNGYIVCKAMCKYPATCEVQTGTQWACDRYCYYDWDVNVCFDGEGEPCCITGGGGF